jgi:hypothetical protein
MSELKMSVYNTHNCHIMLSLFLAIVISVVNQPYLKMVITRICHFFNAISKKVIDVVELDEIHKEMRVALVTGREICTRIGSKFYSFLT